MVTCATCGELNEPGLSYCGNPDCGRALALLPAVEHPATAAEQPVSSLRSGGRLVLPVATVVAMIATAVVVWIASGSTPGDPAKADPAALPNPHWTYEVVSSPSVSPTPEPAPTLPAESIVAPAPGGGAPAPKPTTPKAPPPTTAGPPPPPAPSVSANGTPDCPPNNGLNHPAWGLRVTGSVSNTSSSISSAIVHHSSVGSWTPAGTVPGSGSGSSFGPIFAPTFDGEPFLSEPPGGTSVTWRVEVRLANGSTLFSSYKTTSYSC